MKKIFTLAATLFAAICMNAGDVTIALTSMTAGENSYAYDGAEIKAKNNNVYIELPGANVQGSITIKGSSNKSDRFIYIYGEGGTVKDESRAIEMKSDGGTINFSASDIILVSEVPYLLFSTTDDFKFKKFNYTYEEGKAIVSTVETLTGVSANGVAMSADEFSNLLLMHNAGFPNDEFAAAPTFVFYRNTVITYEDESTKVINDSIEVVGVEDGQGDWAASATIGGVEYSVYAGKAVAVTITYMDGETVLGTEIIAEADYAEDYVNFESKPLATFLGWFSDPELTTPVDFTIPVYTDITVYAKFEKAYASSLNIEQLVLDNGKKYDIKSALLASGYDYKDINELDSLNDEKTARNEPYLGLKIKKQGGYIACNVQAGHTIRVKFGYVAADVKAYANDQEMTLAPVENALEVLEFTATEETFVKLETTSGSTVVIKQIMIDEQIAEVTLPASPEPTGINNAEEAVKTVKVIRNGQLFIEKNGVLFNAQGARL